MLDIQKQDGNKKTATSNGEKTQFHFCKRDSQIRINRCQISDSSSTLTGVANMSQVVGLDTGEQSPEEGRIIKKKSTGCLLVVTNPLSKLYSWCVTSIMDAPSDLPLNFLPHCDVIFKDVLNYFFTISV